MRTDIVAPRFGGRWLSSSAITDRGYSKPVPRVLETVLSPRSWTAAFGGL